LVPVAEIRAFATAVAAYADATVVGWSARVLRSTTSESGFWNASWTAETASAGLSPPTRTPATRTPVGRTCVDVGGGTVVVVVVVVVVSAVVVDTVDVDVDVVTSAMTVPENTPATAKPSTKRTTACKRFTARAV
jgi:hypothetical protein